MIKLVIDPVPKPRMTKADAWKKRPCVLRYWAYKGELNSLLRKDRIDPVKQWSLLFIVPMPKSWPKKKQKEMLGMPHQNTPDRDNYDKGFWDALFEEDKEVWSAWPKKRWGKVGGIVIREITPETIGDILLDASEPLRLDPFT